MWDRLLADRESGEHRGAVLGIEAADVDKVVDHDPRDLADLIGANIEEQIAPGEGRADRM